MEFARFTERNNSRFYWLILFGVLIAGFLIRVTHFPHLPPGLNQDEASSAYEAWSLAETGKDRWGNALPVYFPSWGSGQNVLLAYLTVPAVKLLGLNIFSARIVSLIFGLLTLPLVFFTLWPTGRYRALMGLLIVSLVPWHFMLSRWGLESNLLPFFMLLGCCLMSRAAITGRKRWIFPCLIPLALSLYAYGITIVVLGPFLILFFLINRKAIFKQWRSWTVAFSLFIIVSFPFLIYFTEQYILGANMAWADHLFFSTPLCPSTRLSQVNGSDLFSQNFSFIISGFNDGGNYNLMHHYPLLFWGCNVLGLAGIFSLIVIRAKRIKEDELSASDVVTSTFAIWGLSALLLFFLVDLNVNRFNHFILPCIVMCIWLINYCIQKISSRRFQLISKTIFFLLIIAGTVPSVVNYFSEYGSSGIAEDFNSGLDEAFGAVKKLPVQEVYITNQMPLPYMYTLFYLQYSPAQFRKEVKYQVSSGIYQVYSFGRYQFDLFAYKSGKSWGFLTRKGELQENSLFAKKVTFQNDDWEVGLIEKK